MEDDDVIDEESMEHDGGNVEVISIEENNIREEEEQEGEGEDGEEDKPLITPLTEHRTIVIERDPVFIHISDLHIRSPKCLRNDKRWYATKNLFRHFTEEYCDKEVFVIITGNVTNHPLVNMNLFISAARSGIKEAIGSNDPVIIKGGIQLSHFHIFSSAGNHDCYSFGYINISKRVKGKFEGYTRQDLVDPVWIEIEHHRYDNTLKKRKYHLIGLDSTEKQSDPFTSMGKLGGRQLSVFKQILTTIRSESTNDKIFVFLHHNPFTEIIELCLKLRHRMQRIIEEVQEGGFLDFKTDMMLLEDGDEFLDILDCFEDEPEKRIDVLMFGHIHLFVDLFQFQKFEKGVYEPLTNNSKNKELDDEEADDQVIEEEEIQLQKEYQEQFKRVAKFKIIGESNTTGVYKDPESGKWATSYSRYLIKYGKKKNKKNKKDNGLYGNGDDDSSSSSSSSSDDDESERKRKNKKVFDDKLEFRHVVGVNVLTPSQYALGTFGCCNIL